VPDLDGALRELIEAIDYEMDERDLSQRPTIWQAKNDAAKLIPAVRPKKS
jgi:hypothetical protein